MLIKEIVESGLLNDDTEVWICDSERRVLAHGNWYQDNILDFHDRKIESFTWQDDNKVYIDVK